MPLRYSFYDAVVELDRGMATKPFQDFINALIAGLPTVVPLDVKAFGAAGNGVRNDTAAIQKAINQGITNGGATIILPSGTYLIDTLTFPAGNTPLSFVGQGESSQLIRASQLASGVGLLDVRGSNVTFADFLIDGATTVPAPLFYNTDFIGIGMNDPMADSLTRNSSIWLHGGTRNFAMQGVTIQHTGGYAVLIDAMNGSIQNVRFAYCKLINNRPSLFGVPGGQALYGSWNGGIYCNGDGRLGAEDKVVKQVFIIGCRFMRNTGNQFWQHLYGLEGLHEDFQAIGNYFLDIGLDGILIGGVTGGAVLGNVFRRIGYTTMTDIDRSYPRWLPNLQATALDSSGVVKSVVYANNSMLSVNGGNIDADGHGMSVFAGNVCRIPIPGEPEYDEDQIAVSGPLNDGSYSYGINVGNTSQTSPGASDLTISGNSLLNLPGGAIRLFSARNCLVTANNIVSPDAPKYPPLGMGPQGPAPNQRCYGNKVTGNLFRYNPASAAPCVFEDDTYGAFDIADVNTVCNNVPIQPTGTMATEFLPSLNSGSVQYLETIWFT